MPSITISRGSAIPLLLWQRPKVKSAFVLTTAAVGEKSSSTKVERQRWLNGTGPTVATKSTPMAKKLTLDSRCVAQKPSWFRLNANLWQFRPATDVTVPCRVRFCGPRLTFFENRYSYRIDTLNK